MLYPIPKTLEERVSELEQVVSKLIETTVTSTSSTKKK